MPKCQPECAPVASIPKLRICGKAIKDTNQWVFTVERGSDRRRLAIDAPIGISHIDAASYTKSNADVLFNSNCIAAQETARQMANIVTHAKPLDQFAANYKRAFGHLATPQTQSRLWIFQQVIDLSRR